MILLAARNGILRSLNCFPVTEQSDEELTMLLDRPDEPKGPDSVPHPPLRLVQDG
jgi:hypothetical protein